MQAAVLPRLYLAIIVLSRATPSASRLAPHRPQSITSAPCSLILRVVCCSITRFRDCRLCRRGCTRSLLPTIKSALLLHRRSLSRGRVILCLVSCRQRRARDRVRSVSRKSLPSCSGAPSFKSRIPFRIEFLSNRPRMCLQCLFPRAGSLRGCLCVFLGMKTRRMQCHSRSRSSLVRVHSSNRDISSTVLPNLARQLRETRGLLSAYQMDRREYPVWDVLLCQILQRRRNRLFFGLHVGLPIRFYPVVEL